MIILLFCFSLQAQQKRWQLDSIQQIQFYSDKMEYVYKTLHQFYDPKTRTITKINEIKDPYSDDYMYICKYNKQDSLISETQYIYIIEVKRIGKNEKRRFMSILQMK